MEKHLQVLALQACEYTALNLHKIWPRLLSGEHILNIRAKMTPFFNIRSLTGVMACLIKTCES